MVHSAHGCFISTSLHCISSCRKVCPRMHNDFNQMLILIKIMVLAMCFKWNHENVLQVLWIVKIT